MTAAELLFFDECPQALPVYEALRAWALNRWPETAIRVQKTQITFGRPKGYAVVSLPRRKAERAAGAVVLSFSLPQADASPRIMAKTQISARRWTHHVLLNEPEDLDAQVRAWVEVSAAHGE